MGWLDGLVICSSAVSLQPLVNDLIDELKSIQTSKSDQDYLKSAGLIDAICYTLVICNEHNQDLEDVIVLDFGNAVDMSHTAFQHSLSHDKVHDETYQIAGVTEAVLYAILAYCKAYGCP